jgi:UDPglucose 6-dehydrogenase
MSLENAELTKLAVNTFVTTKITFANMLADLCERIPGGDVDVVCDALGLDKRLKRYTVICTTEGIGQEVPGRR